jgi:hypothetical protein
MCCFQTGKFVRRYAAASLLISAVMLGSTVGWSRLKDSLYSVPLFASLVAAATDWGLDVLKAGLYQAQYPVDP